MLQLAKLMDDLDDVMGIVSAATSRIYILIIGLAAMLVIVGAVAYGLRGLIMTALASGVAIAAATVSTSRK